MSGSRQIAWVQIEHCSLDMNYVILRHQLAAIIGRIVHHFQQLRTTSHYSEVVALDDELLHFMNTLPPQFSLDPDRSLDETFPYVPIHRFLLVTEVLSRRIATRAACFGSAIKDFDVRRAFRETVPEETQESLSSAYPVNVLCNGKPLDLMSYQGIYLVLNPAGIHSTKMHDILDHFVASHDGVRELDSPRAQDDRVPEEQGVADAEPSGRPPPHSRILNGDSTTEHPAHLLPGLHLTVHHEHGGAHAAVADVPPPAAAARRAGGFAMSPTSASPSADDDAQHLLDNWCNALSNGPLDGVGASMGWGGGPGASEASGWVGTAPMLAANPKQQLLVISGDDSNLQYWEALTTKKETGHLAAPSLAEKLCRHRRGEARDCP
ncbi:hypothetical protein C8J57DRAFT_1241126 [Mycena rebaudengoi]|nr:hypothetical protein C8J57DRAFT_1241126 [Mycena rebaudengoi]